MTRIPYEWAYYVGLIIVALVLAGLLAGCSGFSFRLGELSWEGEHPEYTIRSEGLPALK